MLVHFLYLTPLRGSVGTVACDSELQAEGPRIKWKEGRDSLRGYPWRVLADYSVVGAALPASPYRCHLPCHDTRVPRQSGFSVSFLGIFPMPIRASRAQDAGTGTRNSLSLPSSRQLKRRLLQCQRVLVVDGPDTGRVRCTIATYGNRRLPINANVMRDSHRRFRKNVGQGNKLPIQPTAPRHHLR